MPSIDEIRRALDDASSDYQNRILAGGGIRTALQKSVSQADPIVGQVRTARNAALRSLGTLFVDSQPELERISDPFKREQIRATRSSGLNQEAGNLGGQLQDLGASQGQTINNLSDLFGAITGAKQFDVSQKRSDYDQAVQAAEAEKQRQFQADQAAKDRASRGGGGGGPTIADLVALQKNPLVAAQLAGYTRAPAPNGGKGFWFYDRDGNPVKVDQVASAVGASSADLLNGSDNPWDQQRIQASAGKPALPQKALDTINTLSSARGVIDQLGQLSGQINSGTSSSRIGAGINTWLGGLTQSNPNASLFASARQGFLATLARASGERGVLTDQDVKRASQLLPNIFDSREVAQRKLGQLTTFLDGIEQRTRSTYSGNYDSPGQPSSPASPSGIPGI